jgi:hypothetical protein
MAYDISRRFLLAGATGLGVAGATACASGASAIAETTEAAFPPEKVAVENPTFSVRRKAWRFFRATRTLTARLHPR